MEKFIEATQPNGKKIKFRQSTISRVYYDWRKNDNKTVTIMFNGGHEHAYIFETKEEADNFYNSF